MLYNFKKFKFAFLPRPELTSIETEQHFTPHWQQFAAWSSISPFNKYCAMCCLVRSNLKLHKKLIVGHLWFSGEKLKLFLE